MGQRHFVRLPIIAAMLIATGVQAAREIRHRITEVKPGKLEGPEDNPVDTITFKLDGVPHKGYLRGRNAECVVGISDEADRAIANRCLLGGNAVKL